MRSGAGGGFSNSRTNPQLECLPPPTCWVDVSRPVSWQHGVTQSISRIVWWGKQINIPYRVGATSLFRIVWWGNQIYFISSCINGGNGCLRWRVNFYFQTNCAMLITPPRSRGQSLIPSTPPRPGVALSRWINLAVVSPHVRSSITGWTSFGFDQHQSKPCSVGSEFSVPNPS